MASIRNDIGGINERLRSWDVSTTKLMNIELKVANLSEKVHDHKTNPEYVINDATKICHRVLHMRGPPMDWVPRALSSLAVRVMNS